MRFSVLTLLPFFLIIHSLNANTLIDLGDISCDHYSIQTPIEGGTIDIVTEKIPIEPVLSSGPNFISPSTTRFIKYFIATPYDGYVFSHWLKDGNEIIGTPGLAITYTKSSPVPCTLQIRLPVATFSAVFITAPEPLPPEEQPLAPVLELDTFYESNSGESITIDATPTEGSPTNYTYQWYFNDSPISPSLGGASSSLTLAGISFDGGTWKVEVTNDTGTTSAEFEYRVFTDSDGDGLSNYRESSITNTDPDLLDSDSDGLNDYAEVVDNLTDPNDSDSDDDGLNDGSEVISHLTDPNDSDSDDDGLSDGAEVNTHSTDPKDTDSDDDGLLDGAEVNTHLTNPNLADSDSDGLHDGAEVNTHSTDPLASDSSGDGLSDGAIVAAGFDPNVDYTDLLNAQSSDSHNARGYYSASQLEDARTGAVIIEATGSTATLQLQIERSENLTSWTQHEDDLISVPMQMNGDKQFFRFAMPQQ